MKSLSTALRLLMEFTGDQPVLGVGELAERSGLPKGQVSKILSTFRNHGVLTQDPATRRYSVGLAAFALGSRFVNHHPLSREALPILRRIVEQTGHSGRLSIMGGEKVVYLLQSEGPLLIDTGWRVGTFLPLHATTAGKVALAFLEPERVDELLGKEAPQAITPSTITDPEEVRSQLAAIRRTGYGISLGETTQGLGTLGVPVFGRDNGVLAVLGIAFPIQVVPRSDMPRLAAVLHGYARALSQRMGCPVYPFGGAEPNAPPRARAGRQNMLQSVALSASPAAGPE